MTVTQRFEGVGVLGIHERRLDAVRLVKHHCRSYDLFALQKLEWNEMTHVPQFAALGSKALPVS